VTLHDHIPADLMLHSHCCKKPKNLLIGQPFYVGQMKS